MLANNNSKAVLISLKKTTHLELQQLLVFPNKSNSTLFVWHFFLLPSISLHNKEKIIVRQKVVVKITFKLVESL